MLGLWGAPASDQTARNFMSQMQFTLQVAGPRNTEFTPRLPTQECHVNDVGIQVIVQFVDSDGKPIDIRPQTSLLLRCLRPDGTTYDAKAGLYTNGMDGKASFISDAHNPPFDQAGTWWIQGTVTLAGNVGPQSTRWGKFAVEPNIDPEA